MTLKCKIKEISELKTEDEIENFKRQKDQIEEQIGQVMNSEANQLSDAEENEKDTFDLISEDEFQLQELGTIEEMSQKAFEKRRLRAQSRGKSKAERSFYDRNSICKRPRKYVA